MMFSMRLLALMLRVRAVFLVALGVLPLACGSSSGGSMNATDGGDAGLTGGESAVFETGSGAFAVNQQLAELADNLFDFDPTIDPKGTPDQNANAIGSNALSNLGKSCGKVTVSGAGVTVAFGSAPGCTLKNGETVSGTVVVALSFADGTTTVDLTLTDVVYDSVPISGTASFSTANGSSFIVKTSLTSSATSDSGDLTVMGASGSFLISGTATVTMDTTSATLTLKDVTVTKGECYATSGSIVVDEGAIEETLTFDSSTPQTGQVSVLVGKVTTTRALPAYGSCPSGS
jgi:hypothetical protein